MPEFAQPLPSRRPELVIRPFGEGGRYVVKDPGTGAYFHVGDQEHFLLEQLDGQNDAATACAAFEQKFAQPLSGAELAEFVRLARARGLLTETRRACELSGADGLSREVGSPQSDAQSAEPRASRPKPERRRQSILYWRKRLFDPDRLFTWLTPRLWFFWTRAFLMVSAGCIALAVFVLWANRYELASSFQSALRWETIVLVWLTLVVVTICHEFAHGLTCKHYGGEVHEIGFLLLLLMPCFYCNVSDAWLFREKSKRMWVMFAGGYCELFLWALSVLVWRVTPEGSLPNFLAFVVLSVSGIRTLFNFNPLIKLDGYYLLSDWLEMPNLQPRALGHFKAHLRRLLWGAPRPAPQRQGRLLFRFGLAAWLNALVLLALMLAGLFRFAGSQWGVVGGAGVGLLALVSVRGACTGISAGEVRNMFVLRRVRTAAWLLTLGGLVAALCLVEMEDRPGGCFELRPAVRAELRAPVAGFLKEVHFDEGDRVSCGATVAQLEVPDLASRIAQKRAEIGEAQAKLKLSEIGPRPEEVAEQRGRVERMTAWRDLAEKDLTNAQQALKEELCRLDKAIEQFSVEVEAARDALERAQQLRIKKAVAEEQYREAERRFQSAQAQLGQAQSQKRHREALKTREAIAGLDAESELARREKDLADAQATLNLMEAGSRPEQIEAERAGLARLQEEARYLEGLQAKVVVVSPVAGLVTTPRLKERVGQFVREGESILVVEEPADLEADITLAEQDIARVRAGQAVHLKPRALPFESFAASVDRIAPTAGKGEQQSNLTVYCRLEATAGELRPGMTGYARVYTGRRPIGAILLDRAMHYVRPEFWW